MREVDRCVQVCRCTQVRRFAGVDRFTQVDPVAYVGAFSRVERCEMLTKSHKLDHLQELADARG